MDCNQAQSLLHGYLDQELDLASVVAFDQHLPSCAACKKIFDQQSKLRLAVRQHVEYFAASGSLADRIRTQIHRPTPVSPAKADKPRWDWLHFGEWEKFGAVAAATAGVTWVAALQLNGPSQDALMMEQVIAGYGRSVLTNHVTDVATSDQHTVKPWLSSKLPFSPAVTDLTTAGFPLIGGRLDLLDNRPVAALVYGHRQHLINLFVWPDQKPDRTTPMQTSSLHGYNLLHWTDAGMKYWAISDLSPADIKIFAEAYASAK